MPILNSKSISRIAVIQILYQILISYDNDTKKFDLLNKSIDEIIENTKSNYKIDISAEDLGIKNIDNLKIRLNVNFFESLTKQSVTNINSIISKISNSLNETWLFENLHISLQAILIVSFCEMIYFPEIPGKVIVNEYTNIASDMLKNTEVGFVNSILDSLSKEVRENE